MKQCPRCNQTYSDSSLNFCLNDGELLTNFANEPQRRDLRMMLRQLFCWIPHALQTRRAGSKTHRRRRSGSLKVCKSTLRTVVSSEKDQTLPLIAMILGILSIALICCYGGIWMGLPAAILGFLGMRNADNDPGRYTGRGMAVAGMVLGAVSLLASLVVAVIALVAR